MFTKSEIVLLVVAGIVSWIVFPDLTKIIGRMFNKDEDK